MCTVTYIPSSIDNSYFLTSNRDEKVNRIPASIPEKRNVGSREVLFPKDGSAGGTWIASEKSDFSLCLMNGAFENHVAKPPYRLSRGLMLLDFFKYNNVELFKSEYKFDDIEPFTLLAISSNGKLKINELRWDGKNLFDTIKDSESSHIWSSATLYDKNSIEKKEGVFDLWLKENQRDSIKQEDITRLHKEKFLLQLEQEHAIISTVSITSIMRTPNQQVMSYYDLLENRQTILQEEPILVSMNG